MKKVVGFILVVFVIFLASCSTSGAVMKRKYNKGYYIDIAKQHVKKQSNHKIINLETEDIALRKLRPANITSDAENKIAPIDLQAKHISINENKKVRQPSISTYTKKAVIKQFILNNHKVSTKVQNTRKAIARASGGDISVVEVILSLFPILCLIAVFMHDGGITINFWVDLILHLTLIGEIIFALLVVLNILSLN